MKQNFQSADLGVQGRHGIKSKSFLILGIMAVLVLSVIPMTASATVLDKIYVGSFEVNPSYINLGMETSIDIEIIQSHGAGLDNYRVTLTAPDNTQSKLWVNFTETGSKNVFIGRPTSGFKTSIDQVGIYNILLEYFNGTTYRTVATTELGVTDELVVVVYPHAPANTWTEEHTCPQVSQFERGNSVMMRAETYYLSNGEKVPRNASMTTVLMEIPGVKLFNPLAPEDASDSEKYAEITTMYLGHGGFGWQKRVNIEWDTAVGSFPAYLHATDIYGNSGEGEATLTFLPSRLDVNVETLNGSTVQSAFEIGDTVNFVVNVTYKDRGKTHGYNYHGPNDWGSMPMDTTRADKVKVRLGSGYDPASNEFAVNISTIDLSFDAATGMWVGSYDVTEEHGDVTAIVEAFDKAPGTPNSGYSFANLAFVKPLVVTKTVTEYVNKTVDVPVEVEVEKSTGFEIPIVGAIAIIMLIVGLGIGVAVFRKGKNQEAPNAEPRVEKTDENQDEENDEEQDEDSENKEDPDD